MHTNIEDGRHLRALKTRHKLIKAAEKVFIQEGFQQTTIKQIIKEAGVGYGTAYGHFNGKDEFLIVLMEDVMDKFFNVAKIPFFPTSKDEARDIILHQVLSFLEIAETERPMMKIFLEAKGLSDKVNTKWTDIQQQFIQSITKDITYSQMQGLVRTDLKAELVARSWFYSNEMYQWEIVLHTDTYHLQEVAETLTTMYTDAIYK